MVGTLHPKCVAPHHPASRAGLSKGSSNPFSASVSNKPRDGGPSSHSPCVGDPSRPLRRRQLRPREGRSEQSPKAEKSLIVQSGLETWVIVPAPSLLLRHTQRSGQVFLCLRLPCQSWGGGGHLSGCWGRGLHSLLSLNSEFSSA